MIYKTVPQYPRYGVSKDGCVINNVTGRKLKPYTQSCGYKQIQIVNSDGVTKHVYVHRLVAMAFIDNTYEKEFVNHKNGKKWDNNYKNLEWVSAKENTIHAVDNNLLNIKGSKNASAKLFEDEVKFIKLWLASGYTHTEISNNFNVTRRTVGDINSGKSWSWLTI